MALGISASNFSEILSDLGVSVTLRTATRVVDTIYGSETVSYANSTKTYIFFKNISNIDLTKWGIIDIGDAYVIIPATETLNYGDRIVFDSETYEFTPECKEVKRYANNVAVYHYYTLRKVA